MHRHHLPPHSAGATSTSMAQAGGHRSKGTVKWFNAAKGFGFISPGDGGDDLFVHQSSIKSGGYRTLAEGEEIEFTLARGEDGRTKAADVTGPSGAVIRGSDGRRAGTGYGSTGGRVGRRSVTAGGGGGGFATCYVCGGYGHMARDCSSFRSGRGGGGGGGACYNCGQIGHFARECSAAMK